MQFAHFAQIFPRPGQSAGERYEQLWRELELCDELGFDYGFASVHHLSHLRPPAAAYCTAAAARTRRMRIGPMGYTPALHDPLRVVEEMAVLDNILGGRLEVGLTAGVTRDEFRVYKKDWDNRSAIAAEALQLVHTAFTQPQPFTFNGRYHSYEDVCLSVQPLQRPYPPTWLITLAPENLKLAAKMGADTGFLFVSWHRVDAAEQIREYLRMWKEMGHARQPRVIYETFVYVDKSDEAAREKAAPHIAISLEEIYGGSRSGGGVARAAQMTTQGNNRSSTLRQNMFDVNYLLDNDAVFVGSPETVARKIKAAAEEGLFNVMAAEFNIGTLDEESLMRSIRLFGAQVMPAIRDIDPIAAFLKNIRKAVSAA